MARRHASTRRLAPLSRLLAVVLTGVGVLSPLLAVAAPPAAAATDICGFSGAVTVFDGNGASSGGYDVSANWDGDAVPYSGQVCIPAGKTATVPVNTSVYGTVRVEGTLRVLGAGVQTSANLDVAGRLEVASGAGLLVGFGVGRVDNRAGGVVRVEAGATFGNYAAFANVGGQIDLTGGGRFFTSQSYSSFLHGDSGGPAPVPSTVVGGPVEVQGPTQISGTGAASFLLPEGAYAGVTGVVHAGQTVDVRCTGSYSYLNLTANLRNEGTITAQRQSGTTCTPYIQMAAGITLTNAGTIVLGDLADQTAPTWITGGGAIVNEAGGVIETRDAAYMIGGTLTNDGTVNVAPGASLTFGDSLFELRSGVVNDEGAMRIGRSSASYGFLGVVRVLDGALLGNPMQLDPGYLELLGPGEASFVAKSGEIRNPTGTSVVGPRQTIIFDDGNLASYGSIENRGLLRFTGTGSGGSSLSGTGVLTNRGRIELTRSSGTTTDGYSSMSTPLVNESSGVVVVDALRNCSFGDITNRGLIDIARSCTGSGVMALAPSSVLRVRSSAVGLAGWYDLAAATLGGALDVVTDAGSVPGAGAARDLMVGHTPNGSLFRPVTGSFATITGARVSGGLGYVAAYPTVGGGRRAQLQVVPQTYLTVGGVTAPAAATVGDQVGVQWTTTVGGATSLPWTESVFLSATPTVDESSILLGRLSRSGSFTAGQVLPGSLNVTLSSFTPGVRYLVVVADSGSALVADAAAALSSTSLRVDATTVTVGAAPAPLTVPGTGALVDGARLLRLSGSPDQDVVVTVTPATGVSLYAASGRAPSETDHDAVGVGAALTLPKGDGAAERYVLVRNTGVAAQTVSVSAVAPGLAIASSSPAVVTAGSPVATAVTVTGTGFAATSAAQLVCGTSTVNATSTQVDSSTRLTSLFALPTALGVCDVRVGTSTRAGALTVLAPSVGVDPTRLEVDVEVVAPAYTRSEVDNRITVRWTNRTAYSLPAPLITVSSDGGRIRFPDGTGLGSSAVEVLGIASTGPAGILAPGASGSVDLLVRTENVAAHAPVSYFVAHNDVTQAFDFGAALVALLGDDVPAAAKTFVRTTGPTIVGGAGIVTKGAFIAHLGDIATVLGGAGRRVADPARLVGYDLGRITVDQRLDAFRTGELGIGTPGLSLPRLRVEARTGDVILSDGETSVRFGHQSNNTFVTPVGFTDSLTANPSGFALTASDGTRRQYSTAGLLTTVTTPEGRTTTFAYAGTRLTSVTDPDGSAVTYGYDGSGRITTIVDAVGRITTFAYDGGGHLATVTENGLTTTTTWGPGDLPASVTGPDGVLRSIERDGYGRVTALRVNGAVSNQVTFEVDGSITDTDALGRTTRTWNDDTGATAKVVDPLGRTTTARRSASGAAVGVLVDGVPAADLVMTDTRGWVTGGVDGAGGTNHVTHDFDGRLLSVTDEDGRLTATVRDDRGRPVRITDPLGRRSTIGYDVLGRAASVTDRTGVTSRLGYTPTGELSSLDITGYGGVTYTYDARRRVRSVTGPTGATSFTYDTGDRVASVTYPTGLSITYGYDAAGRRLSVTTSDGQVTGSTYDARGRLATSTAGSAAGAVTVATYEYDAADRLAATAYANGSRTETTRDAGGRIMRVRTTCCTPNGVASGPTVVSDVQLTFDARDRVLTRTEGAGTTTYGYDGAGRLMSAVTTGATPRAITYTYDGNGNRLTKSDSVAGGATAATLDGAGRPTQIGADALTYDLEGRRTTIGATTTAWDARGALVSTVASGVTSTYQYDALGTPIARTVGGVTTRLLVDPTGVDSLLAEYSATNVRQAGYVWGQGLTARLDGSGTPTSFYTSDARGDVVALTAADGSVTDTYRYLPFGELAARTGTTAQPFAFQGRWGLRTEASGLVNARARIYDPATGRFLAEDPVQFAAANPATWAASDPVNQTDTTGRSNDWFADTWNDPWMALGFSSGDGVTAANIANGEGIALTPVANALGRAEADLARMANPFYEQGLNLARGGARLAKRGGATNNQAAAKLFAEATERLRLGDKWRAAAKNFAGAGTVLKGLGGALNVIQGYEAWKKDPTFANGVRQGGKAFVKTFASFGASLLVDPAEAYWDMSTLQLYQDYFGYDPVREESEYGWNARVERKKKKGQSENLFAGDPNELIGPAGATVGTTRFVGRDDVLPYRVNFENIPTATLPANEVVVTEVLDADLDLATFELAAVGIGGREWPAPAGVRSWSTLLDDRDRSGLYVKLRARLDVGTRTVTWTFTGIDPETGDRPAAATLGFLPPNTTTPRGQGFATYRVQPLASVPTGTAVVAQASIVFDANAAIATNVDTVVVDADAPSAAITVPATSTNPVPVTIGGVDGSGGSGLGATDLWVSTDGGSFVPAGTADTATFSFTGVVGHSYRFLALPADKVGNVGAFSAPSTAVRVQAVGGGGVAPVAVADTATTVEDAALGVGAPGVLGNDTDADADALLARLVSGTAHGTVTLATDGSYTYAPTANFHGTDSFTYVANDGTADSAPATATITVTSMNDAPVAQGDIASGPQDAPITVAAPGVLGNDSDVDGDALTARVVGSGPGHGTLTLLGNGGYTYTPAAGYAGTDSFTYVANDGAADSAPATVTITLTATGGGTPGFSVSDAAPVSEWTGARYAELTVTLDAPRTTTTRALVVTIDGTARAGLDYVPVIELLTFKPGEVRRTVRVAILSDCVAEAAETFALRIIGVTGAPVARGVGAATISADPVPAPARRPPEPLAPGHTCPKR